MKKFYFSLVLLLFTGILQAQEIDAMRAIQLVTKNISETGLSYENLSNSMVSNAFVNSTSGTDMVYLQQMHKGLPVFNQIQVMAFKNGKLVSNAGNRIWEIDRLSGFSSEQPVITAEQAINSALAAKKLTLTSPLVSRTLVPGRKYDFGKPGQFIENITAELMWVPSDDGSDVKLAWQVYLVPQTSSDYWLIRVDAKNNRLIGENNLTVYCQFHKRAEKGTGESHLPAKNANADDNVISYVFGKKASENSKNIRILNADPASPSIINSASYRVIPFPAERRPWSATPGIMHPATPRH